VFTSILPEVITGLTMGPWSCDTAAGVARQFCRKFSRLDEGIKVARWRSRHQAASRNADRKSEEARKQSRDPSAVAALQFKLSEIAAVTRKTSAAQLRAQGAKEQETKTSAGPLAIFKEQNEQDAKKARAQRNNSCRGAAPKLRVLPSSALAFANKTMAWVRGRVDIVSLGFSAP